MIRFFKQSKGVTSDGMPSEIPFSTTIAETKVDGSYVQIHKVGKEVRMFTSGGKEFYWADIASTLLHRVDGDVMIEAGFLKVDRLGNILHGGCVKAFFSENLRRGVKDLVSGYHRKSTERSVDL